jgi:hypothetical protein
VELITDRLSWEEALLRVEHLTLNLLLFLYHCVSDHLTTSRRRWQSCWKQTEASYRFDSKNSSAVTIDATDSSSSVSSFALPVEVVGAVIMPEVEAADIFCVCQTDLQ